jgi:hypothetical protein
VRRLGRFNPLWLTTEYVGGVADLFATTVEYRERLDPPPRHLRAR